MPAEDVLPLYRHKMKYLPFGVMAGKVTMTESFVFGEFCDG
jgi:hypothetical protein